ncbi:class II aldolase/adducin family protein [Anaerotruncus rubiinfantis]|uniref:class II aldolase/adducin family protein n=1 Tax=Anaerotruncus rubiinfantis TaxID=1720200 RepID=UPI00082F2DB8|nr:class II aldolase/adducin family protein [Anaerotruncus rubiinfantis]
MDRQLQQKMETAIWIGRSLFERGKTAGSSANMSFLHEGTLYITGSGTCFGTLTPEDFSRVGLADGEHTGGIKPSKELPLHQHLYQKSDAVQAVIHTHSFYAALWSCLPHPNPLDVIPSHTPYLKMKLGTVGLIPYAKPGSQELFSLFAERVGLSDGYLLANHGPVVAGKNLMDAFFALEELEESAHIAWELRGESLPTI